MKESEIIALFASFSGITGSILIFFLYPQIKDKDSITSRMALIVGLLFWLVVCLALLRVKGCTGVLIVAYGLALGGSAVAALLVLYLNIKHIAWHFVYKYVVEPLKQDRELTKRKKR